MKVIGSFMRQLDRTASPEFGLGYGLEFIPGGGGGEGHFPSRNGMDDRPGKD